MGRRLRDEDEINYARAVTRSASARILLSDSIAADYTGTREIPFDRSLFVPVVIRVAFEAS